MRCSACGIYASASTNTQRRSNADGGVVCHATFSRLEIMQGDLRSQGLLILGVPAETCPAVFLACCASRVGRQRSRRAPARSGTSPHASDAVDPPHISG